MVKPLVKPMRVVVTRPLLDGEHTAAAVRAIGHDVLLAPLMSVEPLPAHLAGNWSALIITSANAAAAIAQNAALASLTKLPLFAVGRRSAEAARRTGFAHVISAEGNVHDLERLIAARTRATAPPLLYLAGEDRAADLVGRLSARGIAVELHVVYRVLTAPFPAHLIEALKAGGVDAVMHFSRRSADNFVAGARSAGLLGPALAVQHYCLSPQVAEPLAGALRIAVADRPEEAALIALLRPSA